MHYSVNEPDQELKLSLSISDLAIQTDQ